MLVWAHHSIHAIARQLGHAPSTISRELLSLAESMMPADTEPEAASQ